MGDNYALTVNENDQIHLLGTSKLPDIKNPNSKVECKLLNIGPCERIGAGNKFVLTMM